MQEKFYINSTKYTIKERQTKRGTVYDVIFRVIDTLGNVRQKWLRGFKTKKEANRAYVGFTTAFCTLAKGNTLNQPQTAFDGVTGLQIKDLVPQYIIEMQRGENKGSTIYDKDNVFKRYILPKFGEMRLSEISKQVLKEWQTELCQMINPKTQKPYTTNYVMKIRGYASNFFTWCSEKNSQFKNYFSEIKAPKRRANIDYSLNAETNYWEESQFNQFIETVDDPTFRAFFAVCFYTGRRRGEVIALNRKDVGKDKILFSKTYTRKNITGQPYEITSTKNDRIAYSFICPALAKELEKYVPQEPFFFGGEKPINEKRISRAFDHYVEKSGLPRITMHGLRHSFVSMVIHRANANAFTVAALINDLPEQIFKTYGHFYKTDLKAAIDSLP